MKGQNPVGERRIKTDLKEFYQWGGIFPDLKEQNQKLSEWNEISEDIRSPQALDNLTPNEYYQKCQQKLITVKPLFIKCLPDLSSVYYVWNQYSLLTNLEDRVIIKESFVFQFACKWPAPFWLI